LPAQLSARTPKKTSLSSQSIGALAAVWQRVYTPEYKTFRLSKEEKLYVMKQINKLVLRALVPENVISQHDDENAVCYLT
jgi:hypothetical protein